MIVVYEIKQRQLKCVLNWNNHGLYFLHKFEFFLLLKIECRTIQKRNYILLSYFFLPKIVVKNYQLCAKNYNKSFPPDFFSSLTFTIHEEITEKFGHCLNRIQKSSSLIIKQEKCHQHKNTKFIWDS